MSSQSTSFILVSGSDAATGKTPAASGQGQRVEWAHKLGLLQPPSLFIFFHKTGTWYLLNYYECLLLCMTKFNLSQCMCTCLSSKFRYLPPFTSHIGEVHIWKRNNSINHGKLTFSEWTKAFKQRIVLVINIMWKKRKHAPERNDKWLSNFTILSFWNNLVIK